MRGNTLMNLTKPAQRNEGIDILICVAAFFVVCLHEWFLGEFGLYVHSVARFAVPVFLMITGYFYEGVVRRGREAAQIKKMSLLFLGANFLYFITELLTSLAAGRLGDFFSECFSVKSMTVFLLLNESPFAGHLWYLGATLYALLLISLLRRLTANWKMILYIISPIFIICSLALTKYSVLLWGRELVPEPYYLRNFLFTGLPYFSIGLFLSEHKSAAEKLGNKQAVCLGFVLLFAATTVFEYFILKRTGLYADGEIYLSTTFFAVALFVMLSSPFWNTKKLSLVKKIGRDYSAMIYIIHILITKAAKALFIRLHIFPIYNAAAPIIIFALSVAFSAVYYLIREKLTGRKKA